MVVGRQLFIFGMFGRWCTWSKEQNNETGVERRLQQRHCSLQRKVLTLENTCTVVNSYAGDLNKIVRSDRKRNSEAICSASHGREHCHPRHGSCFGSSDRRQLQNGDGWRSTGTIHVLQKALENSGQRSSNVSSSPPVYTLFITRS